MVSTGNSLDHVEADDAQMAANGRLSRFTTSISSWRFIKHHAFLTDASVKDMEAAAVAWAAELYSIPYFALKVVTDIGKAERRLIL